MPLNATDIIKLEGGLRPSFTSAEQVQDYINIATSLLRDLLLARGWSEAEWNDYRKRITAEEIAFIDSEIARLTPPTDPLPA